MLNRLRQWITQADAPERPIVVNRDGTFTVNDKAMDAAMDAASNRWHWPEVNRSALRRHDDAKVTTITITTPGKKRRSTTKE